MGQVYVKLCAGQRPGPPNILNLLEGSPAPHAPRLCTLKHKTQT